MNRIQTVYLRGKLKANYKLIAKMSYLGVDCVFSIIITIILRQNPNSFPETWMLQLTTIANRVHNFWKENH